MGSEGVPVPSNLASMHHASSSSTLLASPFSSPAPCHPATAKCDAIFSPSAPSVKQQLSDSFSNESELLSDEETPPAVLVNSKSIKCDTPQTNSSAPDSSLGQITHTKAHPKSAPVRPVDTIPPVDGPAHDVLPATPPQFNGRGDITDSDLDWADFVSAYASGQWNPLKIPNQPRTYKPTQYQRRTNNRERLHDNFTSSDQSTQTKPIANSFSDTSMISSPADSQTSESPPNNHVRIDTTVPRGSDHPVIAVDYAIPNLARPPLGSPTIPLSRRRGRKSMTDLRSSTYGQAFHLPLDPSQNTGLSPEAATAAATIRWAGVRVNVSPLALPSPEHEFTDPMRGVHAAIPGSHSQGHSHGTDMSTSTQARKSRLGSFWEGTQQVDDASSPLPIAGSLPTTPSKPATIAQMFSSPETSSSLPPPATAPINHLHTHFEETDYFSGTHTRRRPDNDMDLVQPSSPLDHYPPRSQIANQLRDLEPVDVPVQTVPALPRRICLTRQTSSPLPNKSLPDKGPRSERSNADVYSSFKASRAAKEEQMFSELGYLAPPNPPDELERRRALYKFNIWNTPPDNNFDRIAHLVKLVFNTKVVCISLIDGTEQWFKSQFGLPFNRCDRLTAFCGHTILLRNDEPMVILDSMLDWRFASNPMVTGDARMRFYAGAPLRTAEGYNIGSLAIFDDEPKIDFSPRQRHTLKEFAVIVMREMELWRDKIQLRVRDKIQTSMEQFSRECLEIDQRDSNSKKSNLYDTSMEKVYERAAKLVKRTLDVEEVIVMDVSQCEMIDTFNPDASITVSMHYGDVERPSVTKTLSPDDANKLNSFFKHNDAGKVSEGITPVCFRPFMPTRIQYALNVPVFNVDKRPFALICAYNASDPVRRFLEGHELSYLRAIGVIILSAVLKRRMMLADQSKSLFISNISHELRTPLHGILAAAELLADTPLNPGQSSFLHTVQACGTSLVETVNHVLDFTKLSGNLKSGGVDNVINRSIVDISQLVEEAVDGSWIGFCARNSALQTSEIGSVYSPPSRDDRTLNIVTAPETKQHVEVVVDIEKCDTGWTLRCEKGGIRRVLMNLFGNSLKFTTDGYIQVSLRQLPPGNESERTVKVELSVIDTGKGISQSFLKNQLFQPFSQENPLQTGTGLGLAIVNSIVRSPSVAGKVEVASEENKGTEIKVIFEAERVPDISNKLQEPFVFEDPDQPPSVSLLGFKKRDRGTDLLRSVLIMYLESWWGFKIQPEDGELGSIVVINEDPSPVSTATEKRDTHRSFIVLSTSRGDPRVIGACNAYENMGGFSRILHKPGGPGRLRSVLKQLIRTSHRRRARRSPSFASVGDAPSEDSISLHSSMLDDMPTTAPPTRRPTNDWVENPKSPGLALPSPALSSSVSSRSPRSEREDTYFDQESSHLTTSNHLNSPTVSVGPGGTLLKTSIGAAESSQRRRSVLVVEDNSILRNLLVKWLTKKGYDYREAVDGRQGVNIYQAEGPFDVVLVDLSMPVLDGVGATVEIREYEASQHEEQLHSIILALTGMSSLEDKRKAFEAGMDGYLVKPVAFKTLDEMFTKLGL
ncbi:hypothetical protein CONPUDRAFT_163400 [Coniophora puteana RWD-64-598 SS2]|uniref:Histidine kinase n=1 Tax=Coniophora puteana (strain RWD-64-598) TaxID=741705 RepID=A0A5M3MYK8_CONPW|nr:uncharacterized protein CONPUDRAFT_163400 [Coniophora puteana RWD-64-598 SS2]EIW84222.1 hypothetical protein CONPUDRAFT_163400 [Coniophora puteana RWD-64-598 SS2]